MRPARCVHRRTYTIAGGAYPALPRLRVGSPAASSMASPPAELQEELRQVRAALAERERTLAAYEEAVRQLSSSDMQIERAAMLLKALDAARGERDSASHQQDLQTHLRQLQERLVVSDRRADQHRQQIDLLRKQLRAANDQRELDRSSFDAQLRAAESTNRSLSNLLSRVPPDSQHGDPAPTTPSDEAAGDSTSPQPDPQPTGAPAPTARLETENRKLREELAQREHELAQMKESMQSNEINTRLSLAECERERRRQ